MLRKSRIDLTPKVTAALNLLSELRHGRAYNDVFQRPLQLVSIHDVPRIKSFPRALVIRNYDPVEGTVGCVHPALYLKKFKLDCVSWFKESYHNPLKSDFQKYDVFSDEYVILWSNRDGWEQLNAIEKGVLWVGVSHLGSGNIRVNSFGTDYWINDQHHGTGSDRILLPRI